MKEKILAELKERINKDFKKGPLYRRGNIDLYMKKFVMDEEFENDDFNGDCLSISYPDSFTNKFRLVAEFAKPEFDKIFKFDNLEQVAEFIVKTYC